MLERDNVKPEKLPPCEACTAPAAHWFCKLKLCTKCLDAALKVHVAVPLPSPPATKPEDPRVQQWQRDADAAVYAWCDAQPKARRAS